MNAIIVEIGIAEAFLLMCGQARLDLPEGTRYTAMWMDSSLVDGCEVRKIMVRLEHPDFPEANGWKITRVDFSARKSVGSAAGIAIASGDRRYEAVAR